jgi:hypothetical protein
MPGSDVCKTKSVIDLCPAYTASTEGKEKEEKKKKKKVLFDTTWEINFTRNYLLLKLQLQQMKVFFLFYL